MKTRWLVVVSMLVLPAAAAADEGPSVEQIRQAVLRSLPLLEAGARGAMEKRKQCFTCHNQGLPILALVTARRRGLDIDDEHLAEQLQFAADFLAKNRDNYREGKGQGGQADTAGYALWALSQGEWKPDETTAAVAEYLLRFQSDLDHWQAVSQRPPSEQSSFTTTFLAIRGLNAFAPDEQAERVRQRLDKVRPWLASAAPQDTEDRVFRLRALKAIGAGEDLILSAREELLKTQLADGGWPQLDGMESDAYATGSALVALHEAGGLAVDDPIYRKGLARLIALQHDDGSWHVNSRSKPFQTYFESGYPHGKDQFISIAAAGWATTALALALPEPIEPPSPE